MADENFKVVFELDVRQAINSAQTLQTELGKTAGAIGELGNAAQKSGLVQATQQTTQATSKMGRASREAAQSQENMIRGLSTTRYALYDMANTLGILGGALTAVTAATYGVSIAMEREFANVLRTSNVAGEGVDRLRNDFIRLGQEIPQAFSELTRIGTLGGQLGIAAEELAMFTSVVARFAAVTDDMNEEAVAVAFGRLRALLPDVADGTHTLEQLASAIQLVGVNAVASEGEIVNVAVQLSSMAGYAGLTAAELVGLASALASVGVRPELARGTITRLFIQMGRAVSDAGDTLETFARTAGVSSAEFADAFGTNRFGPIFLSFVEGLGSIQSSGQDVVATLNDLGIASVRDIPALTRLASGFSTTGEAGAILRENIENANRGIREGTELSRQYGLIHDTVASKLQLFANNVQNVLYVLGQGGSAFGGIIDAANDLLRNLTGIAQNPVWNAVAQGVLIFGGLVGVVTLVAAGLTVALAGAVAVTQALHGLNTAGIFSQGVMRGLTGQLVAMGTAGRVAAGALTTVGVAMRGLGWGAAIAGGLAFQGAMARIVNVVAREWSDFDTSMEATLLRLQDTSAGGFGAALNALSQEGAGFQRWIMDISRGLADLGVPVHEFVQDLKRVDDAMADVARSGNIELVESQLNEMASGAGIAVSDLLERLPSVRDALTELGITVEENSDGLAILRGAMNQLTDAEIEAQKATEDLAIALGVLPEELGAFTETLAEALLEFGSASSVFKAVQDAQREWAEGVAASTKSSKDSWQDYYDGVTVTFDQFVEELDKQVQAQLKFADNLTEIAARGAVEFATELAQLGPEGAALAAEAVTRSDEELMRAEELFRIRGERGTKAWVEGLTANKQMIAEAGRQAGKEAADAMTRAVAQSEGAILSVIRRWNLQVPMRVNLQYAFQGSTTRPTVGNPQMYADGGYVRGPGTSKSDSIPARLSNGEYVVQAASVRKYGVGFLDALNRGVARFANGGPVGSAATSGGDGFSGIVELGPRSLGRMGGGGSPTVNVYLDDMAIAKAANRGNKKLVASGGRP